MVSERYSSLWLAAQSLRRRARADYPARRRAAGFAPPEWPPSRGPTPNPRRT